MGYKITDYDQHLSYVTSERKYLCLQGSGPELGKKPPSIMETPLCVYGPLIAIIGPSDIGKHLTSQIMGGVGNTRPWGYGSIIFGTKQGQQPLILSVGQDMSITPNVIWLEDITYKPASLAKAHEKFVRSALQELRVDAGTNTRFADALHSPTQLISLSQEQKQKIALIRAIVRATISSEEVHTLLLDEPFTGLDDESITLMKAAIKKHWPTSIIMIMDSKAENMRNTHESQNFYDELLHFNEATQQVERISFTDFSKECRGSIEYINSTLSGADLKEMHHPV